MRCIPHQLVVIYVLVGFVIHFVFSWTLYYITFNFFFWLVSILFLLGTNYAWNGPAPSSGMLCYLWSFDLYILFTAYMYVLNFSFCLDSKHPATSITASSTISTANSNVKYSGSSLTTKSSGYAGPNWCI